MRPYITMVTTSDYGNFLYTLNRVHKAFGLVV